MATRSCCSTPRTAVAGGRSATSAPAPCRSTKRSSASATIHTSWNCARLTIEPRQRIDTQSEDRSLETTAMNSGCTKPMPHPRDESTFRRIPDYDYAYWRARRPRGERVVELCVDHSVPDIMRFFIGGYVIRGNQKIGHLT